MQFHSYCTSADLMNRVMDRDEKKQIKREAHQQGLSPIDAFYSIRQQQLVAGQDDPAAYLSRGEFTRIFNLHEAERLWIKAGRPFYNLWPKVIPFLLKVNLTKVPASQVLLPLGELALRFPTDSTFKVGFKSGNHANKELPAQALFVNQFQKPDIKDGKAFVITVQVNEHPTDIIYTSHTTNSLFLEDGRSVEECMQAVHTEDGDLKIESSREILRIAVTCCLLSTDLADDLVLPEVLKADEEKWKKTHDPKFPKRAKQRGVYGWSIGKSLHEGRTVDPHWRGPCPLAVYYYGPRPGTPRLRYRKGCWVHREQVERIPTGHEWREEDEN